MLFQKFNRAKFDHLINVLIMKNVLKIILKQVLIQTDKLSYGSRKNPLDYYLFCKVNFGIGIICK